MIRLLTLLFPVKQDEGSQATAARFANGFSKEALKALASTRLVLDARICALPDPLPAGSYAGQRWGPTNFAQILLCTTYIGEVRQYHEAFLRALPQDFLALGMAAQNGPFTDALLAGPEQERLLAFSKWVQDNDLTGSSVFSETPSDGPQQFVASVLFEAAARLGAANTV
jgi:hypothetical protein